VYTKTAGEIADDLSNIDWGDYHLIATDGNTGGDIQFVESVKVTLGGGKTLKWYDGQGESSSGITSGKITILNTRH